METSVDSGSFKAMPYRQQRVLSSSKLVLKNEALHSSAGLMASVLSFVMWGHTRCLQTSIADI